MDDRVPAADSWLLVGSQLDLPSPNLPCQLFQIYIKMKPTSVLALDCEARWHHVIMNCDKKYSILVNRYSVKSPLQFVRRVTLLHLSQPLHCIKHKMVRWLPLGPGTGERHAMMIGTWVRIGLSVSWPNLLITLNESTTSTPGPGSRRGHILRPGPGSSSIIELSSHVHYINVMCTLTAY